MDVQFGINEIETIAAKFLTHIAQKKVVALHGQMGAGKTTFIHAVCNVLGVKDAVSSPTFSIINEYSSASGDTIYHLDLYRLKSVQEAIAAGVEDALYSGNLCLVEWPEITPALFDENVVKVYLSVVGEGERRILVD